MKKLLNLMIVVATFTAVVSCKKDKNIEPEADPISTEELLGHYITIVISGNPSMRILYFSKEGNEVKGTLDIVAARRIHTVNVVNNSFTLDTDGDGKKVYTFKLAKDDSGKLTLSSYAYQNQDVADVSLDYAQIDKVTDAQSFKGKTFAQIDNDKSFIMFPLEVWVWNNAPSYANKITSSYYVISPGAWKGNRNGQDYMGVSVPKWKNSNEPVMLVQNTGSEELAIYKAQ